jgi:hypothetical protein
MKSLLFARRSVLPLAFALLFAAMAFAQSAAPKLPPEDAVRLREFYRLVPQISGRVWANWDKLPAPLLLVTSDTEFLSHYSDPPGDFKRAGDELYARPRQFPSNLLATFPAFGPVSVIVVGEPKQTDSKSSTAWLFVLMHEHFHQLQDSQPGFFDAVNGLGLAHGDKTGMWMLNYPFPYEKPELGRSFARLRDLLVSALHEPDKKKFLVLARQYAAERKKFLGQLEPDDRKYLSFQLWKEGIARYVQIKSAEAAAGYQPSAEFAALPDYESFAGYAAGTRAQTLSELRGADLARDHREVVYSFGAGEGLLLDRFHPQWKSGYFQRLFTLDPYFEQ